MDQQNVTALVFSIALAIIFLVVLYFNSRQNQNVIAVLAKTISDVTNNPVYMENAKASASSIPQTIFDGLYVRMDAIEAFVGEDSEIGKLLQQLEDAAKTVDHDVNNDPVLSKVLKAAVVAPPPATAGSFPDAQPMA